MKKNVYLPKKNYDTKNTNTLFVYSYHFAICVIIRQYCKICRSSGKRSYTKNHKFTLVGGSIIIYRSDSGNINVSVQEKDVANAI
jgi:hypothetical protein